MTATHRTMTEVLDLAASHGGRGLLGDLTDVRGAANLWLVFTDREGQRAARRELQGTWVVLADRATRLNYALDFEDIQGPSLHLAATVSVWQADQDACRPMRQRAGAR